MDLKPALANLLFALPLGPEAAATTKTKLTQFVVNDQIGLLAEVAPLIATTCQ
jgi:hypothetical protein